MCLFGLVSSLPHGSLPRQRAYIRWYPSRYSAGVHPGISCTYHSSTFAIVCVTFKEVHKCLMDQASWA